MSIDKELKNYKARVKDTKAALQKLHDRAREISEQSAIAEDARTALAQVQSEIESLSADKAALREDINEGELLDHDVGSLRAEYRRLNVEVQDLHDEADRLSTVIADNTPDPGEVASVKARLQGIKDPSSGALERAVLDTVADDTETIRARVQAADSLLPTVDVVTYIGALADADVTNTEYLRNVMESIERETEAGRGNSAKARYERVLDRMLTH